MARPLDTLAAMTSYYRANLNLTAQQLADKAGVPQSLISGIQSGARYCGENNARKIATALELTGAEFERFLYLALNGSIERLLDQHKPYPAELLNLLAFEVSNSGIAPESVSRCILKPRLADGTEPDAALYLKDGSKALIEIKVTRI